jgi:hypothetical protein
LHDIFSQKHLNNLQSTLLKNGYPSNNFNAGTYSRCIDDTSVQGIPCSSAIIAKHDPHYEMGLKISCIISKLVNMLGDHFIVTRVQPGVSKGITDLFLLQASCS